MDHSSLAPLVANRCRSVNIARKMASEGVCHTPSDVICERYSLESAQLWQIVDQGPLFRVVYNYILPKRIYKTESVHKRAVMFVENNFTREVDTTSAM